MNETGLWESPVGVIAPGPIFDFPALRENR